MATIPVVKPPVSAELAVMDTDAQAIDALRSVLNQAILGKADVVEYVIACLLARGHLLIEDRPGLGKTTLAKALALAVGGRFARLQCTPDLLPGDITGFNVFNQKTREFEFVAGPVFSDVLLADEVNRTPPRTQSALLEVMAERQVTIDNVRHVLPPNFLVIATQNPLDLHGTYPLPEAQLDRFAMKLRIGYPSREHSLAMLEHAVGTCSHEAPTNTPVFAAGQLDAIHRRVERVGVARSVAAYLVELGERTRAHRHVFLGLSPRGLLTWLRAAQAWALLHHRDYVTPSDVQEVAGPVLEVRLGVEPDAADDVLREILDAVPAPSYATAGEVR